MAWPTQVSRLVVVHGRLMLLPLLLLQLRGREVSQPPDCRGQLPSAVGSVLHGLLPSVSLVLICVIVGRTNMDWLRHVRAIPWHTPYVYRCILAKQFWYAASCAHVLCLCPSQQQPAPCSLTLGTVTACGSQGLETAHGPNRPHYPTKQHVQWTSAGGHYHFTPSASMHGIQQLMIHESASPSHAAHIDDNLAIQDGVHDEHSMLPPSQHKHAHAADSINEPLLCSSTTKKQRAEV